MGNAEKKEFKAESKRLLDMMINSIYTHKEIFLRELISNASDAIDKLYFKSLTDDSVGMKKSDFKIHITPNKEARTLTITDNGIGMTKEDLENNLGTIANSGSLKFKSENKLDEDNQIIGQFGVGFYSAFMVAKKVTVKTKAFGSDTAYLWESEGVDGYSISECEKDSVGTEIVLELLDDTEDEKYSDYLEEYRITSLVKQYSDYIRFPITMDCTGRRKKEGGKDDEYEDFVETRTLNSMVPIWKKNKNELKDEDYNSFYKEKFFDYTDPLVHMHVKNEGLVSYDALLYIPERVPFDYYSKDYEKGLQLYSNGVLIMDKCKDLLPDYFGFVKGLVDSEDLSLNISREMLQHDRQLKSIAKSIEKTIKNELTKMLKNDREKYEKFWEGFGVQLKFGAYSDYGMHKDVLQDLLLFNSSNDNGKLVTLEEYVSRMPESQKEIYYATGTSISAIEKLPQTEKVLDKGYEILYLTENVDEFAIKVINTYKEKTFKSVTAGDLDLDTEEEKEEIKKQEDSHKSLFEKMKNSLGDAVTKVKISSRLKSHPVLLSTEGEISREMEKVLNQNPANGNAVKAQRVLEINANHPIFAKLTAMENDDDKLGKYTKLLYDQALLIEGLPIEDPVEFSNLVCELM